MKKLLKIGFVAVAMLIAAPKLYAQISVGISISANIAPPALPVYVQPPCPTDGYLWQPGYWAWDPNAQDYYWVPGVWVAPPQPGYLWTPSYWGFEGGVYGFHAGYWGEHVGFYGGINYGGGYLGIGFAGGAWSGGHFRYNTAVVNVNRTVIHNTYIDKTVIVNHTVINNNHASFNGGSGGVQAKPRPEELAAEKEHHIPPTSAQQSHAQHAMQNKASFSKANGGRPANVAMNKVGGTHFNAEGSKAPQRPAAAKPAAEAKERPEAATKPEQAQQHAAQAQQHAAQAQQRAQHAQQHAQQAQQHAQQAQQHAQHVQQHSAPRPAAPRPAAPRPEEHGGGGKERR
jgi:hypothetical protein